MSSRARFKVSRWDRLLARIFPGWAVRRVHARAALQLAGRSGYKAAAGGRRTDNWYRNDGDANAAAPAADLRTLRELSRDLRRNNAWARSALLKIVNKTIGWGIRPRAEARALKVWKAWANKTACDYDGRLNFYGLQRLAKATVGESGAAIVLFVVGEVEGLPIPLQLRVLEPDHLDTSRDGQTAGGNTVTQGIERDKRGRRVAYHLYDQHPGSSGGFLGTSKRYPASDVLHIYDLERPGAIQGIPLLTAAIAGIHDLDDYEDAALIQKRIAACFGAFIHDDLDGNSFMFGKDDQAEAGADPEHVLEELEPGMIHQLPPGKSVSFATPPQSTDHQTFTESNLRKIAAGIGGLTFEEMTGDYSKTNYSSARMARLGVQPQIEAWRWSMMIPQMCEPVWQRAMELAALEQGWDDVPEATEWTPPPLPMLDPDKEGLAYQRLVRAGAMTLFDMIRELGFDPEEHLAEIAAANRLLDKLGIVLDSDPRRTAAGGTLQLGAGSGGDAGDDEEDDIPVDEDDDQDEANGTAVQ